jgi:uncharacterized protein (TIGR00375 family)
MSRFFADLHIHSRFSMATSKSLDPINSAHSAKIKGISLVGTGDMVHPGWLSCLSETLVQGPNGLYQLANDPQGVSFVPTGEISLIYTQDKKTRKVHLLFVAPSLVSARKFSETLDRLGNIRSDGRPILGLSCHNLVEIALSVDPEIQIIPAHIWTPWFSLFGSRSGFDSLEECFGDLSSHITALETGLSSDPEMNRLISALDKYALVSFSDAHSPEKLGREATVMQGEVSWATIVGALRGKSNLLGTVEFFPEEGKYYLDGHVKCGPALTPSQTRECQGICPVCGKKLTVGVLSRVTELADRDIASQDGFVDWHLLPLMEVLCQVHGRTKGAQDVIQAYQRLISEFQSEFNVLLDVPTSDLNTFADVVLAKAISNMRTGLVTRNGGYDGQYGVITVMSPAERAALRGPNAPFKPKGPRNRKRGIQKQYELGQKKSSQRQSSA